MQAVPKLPDQAVHFILLVGRFIATTALAVGKV